MASRQDSHDSTRYAAALENCQQLIAVCENVTPGRWEIDGEANNGMDAIFVGWHADSVRMASMHRANLALLKRHAHCPPGCPEGTALVDLYDGPLIGGVSTGSPLVPPVNR